MIELMKSTLEYKETIVKVLVLLIALAFAVPAEADRNDRLKEIGIALILTEVLKKDDRKEEQRPDYRWQGRDHVKEFEVKVDMDRQILDRKIRNCVERGECAREYFRF